MSELCIGDLASLISKTRVSYTSLKQLGGQLLVLLEQMHKLGFSHRDMKPANVLITRSGFLVLTDFGTSKRLTEAEMKLSAGQIKPALVTDDRKQTLVGSEAYLSPELKNGTAHMQPPIDAFGLGQVLHELFFGKPYLGTATWKNVPADLKELLLRLLETDPEKRFTGGWPAIRKLSFFKGVDFS